MGNVTIETYSAVVSTINVVLTTGVLGYSIYKGLRYVNLNPIRDKIALISGDTSSNCISCVKSVLESQLSDRPKTPSLTNDVEDFPSERL
jgi:hypothetical protein